jgi:hypothetical protein
MTHSRIVIALGLDACSIIAAHFAIRENEQSANPLPVVVLAPRCIGVAAIEQATRYLGIPITSVSIREFLKFNAPGDVHVWGVPADDQDGHADMQGIFTTRAFASVLADRALRRADCEELARRAGLSWFMHFERVGAERIERAAA